MDIDEFKRRAGRLKSAFVATRRASEILAFLARLQVVGNNGGPAEIVMILGPSRSGKTRVLEHHRDLHKRPDDPDRGTVNRVVIVDGQTTSTPRSMAAAILRALGDDILGRENEADFTSRIVHLLKEQQCGLLVMDEVHQLIDRDNGKVQHKAANWLRLLANQSPCPLVLCGQPHVEEVVASDVQLRERLKRVFYIDALSWEHQESRIEFKGFLHALEQALELPQPSNLRSDWLALRIHYQSGGLFGRAARLVQEAYEQALLADAPSLSPSHFAEAVRLKRLKGDAGNLNPFLVQDLEAAPPVSPMEDVELRMKAAARRIGGRHGQ